MLSLRCRAPRMLAGGLVLLALSLAPAASDAANWGLETGTPQLQSVGPLAFGPDGILLVGDTKGAAVLAIDTRDTDGNPEQVQLHLHDLNAALAEKLNVPAAEIQVRDLAVNPLSGQVYLSVMAGGDGDAKPYLVRIDAKGQIEPLALQEIPYARTELRDAPADQEVTRGRRRRNPRDESITDLAFNEGRVLVSGLVRGDAPSAVRELPFPFTESDRATRIEIFHGAHGRYEDYAAVRTFVPFTVDGQPSLLAGFTCTPLVKFPLDQLRKAEKVRGTTVAELGNRNQPLDMIVYQKDGQRYLLLANSARGVMKVDTRDIGQSEGITQPVRGGGTAGQPYETIMQLAGTMQLDRLGDSRAVVIIEHDGHADLRTILLP